MALTMTWLTLVCLPVGDRHSGVTEAAGPGPTGCSGPDPTSGTTCDWLYFFDLCGASYTYGPTPGRTGLPSCTPTSTGSAVRIEDERPGGEYFRDCQVLGIATNAITYSKVPGITTGALRIHYTATSARSLTVCAPLSHCPSPAHFLISN